VDLFSALWYETSNVLVTLAETNQHRDVNFIVFFPSLVLFVLFVFLLTCNFF